MIVVTLSFFALMIGVIYNLPPKRADFIILGEGTGKFGDGKFGDGMILCPSKASEKGLCSLDERDLHAKYWAKVLSKSVLPKVNPTFECTIIERPMLTEPISYPSSPSKATTLAIDFSSNFTCNLLQTDEDRFELDLVLIANPDDPLLIGPYIVFLAANYYEPLLPFGLLTRNVMSVFGIADLCILGYGSLAPPFDCQQAALSQREALGISLESSYPQIVELDGRTCLEYPQGTVDRLRRKALGE